ncbi:MAG TPA: acyl-CoA dehydrogenase family protein, partial [Acidimicrobiales bacterium]
MADPHVAAEDRAFVEELRDWLADHLVGEFKAVGGVGGPADDRDWEIRLAWERELAAARWLNVAWPEEYGGRGGTARQELLFHIEHANAEAPYWVGVQGRDLFGPTLYEFGAEAQKKRFLPAITACEEMWGQGFSEPDAGSDLAGLRTRAELDGNEWVITGQKIWTTFGHHADWLYVLCRTNPNAPKHKGISMLLVPRHQAGVEVRTIRNIAGGTEFSEMFFDGARTQADNVVGEIDCAWRVVMGTLGNERAGTTVLPFQAMFRREMSHLLALAVDKGVNRDPVVRQRLAAAWAGLRIMELNNDRLLGAVLRGEHPGPESSVGKLYWANWHRDFGELMVDVLGADALIARHDGSLHPMVHSFLNSRAETIYGGANEIQRNILGERVLGLPKEPS